MKTTEKYLPVYWLNFLHNGSDNNLSTEECKEIREHISKWGEFIYHETGEQFLYSHDGLGFPAMCVKCVFALPYEDSRNSSFISYGGY